MRPSPTTFATVAILAAAALTGCGEDAAEAPAAGDCPVEPIGVVVTVDQWSDLAAVLGGDCVAVSTVISGTSADPHDFEPTPSDSAKIEDAGVLIMNGLDYDHWAELAIESADNNPTVIDAGSIVGLEEGDNPHIWYDPTYVRQVGDAVAAQYRELLAGAEDYLDEQQTAWEQTMAPYDAEVESLTSVAAGRSFASTEPVFDQMAEELGLENRTPQGYLNAALNESEPAPGDIDEFEALLTDGAIDVLIYNTQTEGPLPAQLRTAAESANIAVVEVTETRPEDHDSFVDWQVAQLKELGEALAP